MSFLADWPYFYPLVILAGIGCLGLGRALLPDSPPWRQFLAGLILISAVNASLAWFAPLLMLPLARIGILAGWVILGRQIAVGALTWPDRPDRRTILCVLLAMALGLAISIRFAFPFIVMGEEPYFLGPLVEFFQADYFGPVRVPSHYPWEMTANHILPPAVLTTLAALLPRGTMLQAIEIRFLLLFLAFSRFAFVMMRRSDMTPYGSAAIIAAGLLVFHREIDTCINYSTFLYVILVMEVGIIIFLDRDPPERGARDLLFLLAAMVAAKTSIFYLPALAFLWVAARFPRQALQPVTILAGLVTTAQILTVASRPKPFPDVSIKLTLTNPLGGRPALDYYPNIGDALINQDNILALHHQHYSLGIIAILALVTVKCWLLPIWATGRLIAREPERREIHRVAEVFLLILLAGWVLIRHDQHGITHQVWLTLANAPLFLAAILSVALAPGGRPWRNGLLAVAVAIMLLGYRPWSSVNSPVAANMGGVTPAELVRMSPAEARIRRPNESEVDYCIRSLLHGHRLMAGEVSLSCAGTLGVMAIKPRQAEGGKP
ncbi:hypothetical protein [Magnetospirillum sp. SS-4]|uniref:hypothetical protein n=1 Tax=Magnetospirillum sp. SS-4 TaxID=2681465 RepID=UPI001383C58D|nr:hypothetical protein [Magnetospirillum sp. SS-4]CAA7621025.1 membrane hypothetical protein [Magnetospirillum sp. SS-4]